MAETFYPFVNNGASSEKPHGGALEVRHPARIAVFDDPSAAPRVVVVEPTDIRSYLEQITETVTKLAMEQGGGIPFMVIREIVENLIHAYFMEPTVSILDGGNTIRFSDQGPGIADKVRALEYGTTSATAEMKDYIRGVGSGLPYVQQWLEDKGGSLTVEDNIHQGTVVTISLRRGGQEVAQAPQDSGYQQPQQAFYQQQQGYPTAQPPYQNTGYAPQQQAWPQPYTPQPQAWPQTYPPQGLPYQQPGYGYAPPMNPYQQPWPAQQQMSPMAPQVSERGAFVLDYLRTHDSVGPRDLNALNPLSESTWSRVLTQLEDQGFVSKQGGQKRHLTQQGRQYLGLY